ncbi:hypothetical protein D3C72_1806210 [compost metagenome]
MAELERHAAVGAHVAAVLGEGVAHVGHGTGLVVGQAVHHHRGAADAVALVAALDVIDAFQGAGATVNRALHVVLRHVGIPGLVHRQAQARVGIQVRTAHSGRYRDLLDQAGKNFAALGVSAFFLVLDVRPFAVTSHSSLNRVKSRRRTVCTPQK